MDARQIAEHYQRGPLIGRGPLSAVYHGHDLRTGQLVAIKQIPIALVGRTPDGLDHFLRNSATLAALDYPSIVKVLATAASGARFSIVSEYVAGESLAAQLAAAGPLPVLRVLKVALALSHALIIAHRVGVLHRALRPSNVLLSPDGAIWLLDFAIPLLTSAPSQSATNAEVASAAFDSPEARRGEALDPRADIWSLGRLLSALLTGAPATQEHRHIFNCLQALADRMMTDDREQRTPSMRLVGLELEALWRDQELDQTMMPRAHQPAHTERADPPAAPKPIELPTGMVAFLFTDMEGSTRLWEQYPDAMRTAMARHDALIEQIVAQHAGFVVRPRGEGDSRFVVFRHATAAVAAAVECQRALAAETWPTPTPIRVRMAIHTGEADLREGDYYGTVVNRCARLRSLGYGGQTLLSQITAGLARADLPTGVTLRDMGEHGLKDLSQPERVFQLIIPDLQADFPPLKSLNNRPTNLPLQATPLVGREAVVAEVQALLERAEVRLLTLVGPGGVGKTRLGLQVAAELLDTFADGVFFVALAPISEPALLPATIAQALGLPEAGGQTLTDQLKDYLHEKQLLLLLDNFEQLQAAAPLADELLAAAPHLKLLITSRSALHLYGEYEFTVQPLKLPDLVDFPPIGSELVEPPLIGLTQVPEMAQSPAVALFVQHTRAIKPDFVLNSSNARAVAEICIRLDGLPLAIELAAGRSRVFSPAALLARLNNRLALLTGGARNLTPRQQTLRGAIAWSYDLLTEPEQALFTRLGIFVSGCTLEAAEALTTPPTYATQKLAVRAAGSALLDGLASLVDKSLLQQAEGAEDEPRFVMLETIREYALESLAEQGALEALQQRHASYYLAQAEQAEPQLRGLDQRLWLNRLEHDHDNLRAALRWALDHDAAEIAARMSGALWRFWHVNGHLHEGRQWLKQTLAHSEHLAGAIRAKVICGAGALAQDQGDFAQAKAEFEQGLALYRALHDQPGIAWALNSLGAVLGEQGDYASADALHEESLALYRALGDKSGIAFVLDSLGSLAGEQGNEGRALALFAESLTLRRELGHKQGVADTLLNMGVAALLQGDHELAEVFSEESLTLQRELDDRQGSALALLNLAGVALAQDNAPRAATLLIESLVLCRDLGDMPSIAECLEGLAALAGAHGRVGQAARLWGAAEALRESSGAPLPPVDLARYQSRVSAARAQVDRGAWESEWARGRTRSLQQMIAEALDFSL